MERILTTLTLKRNGDNLDPTDVARLQYLQQKYDVQKLEDEPADFEMYVSKLTDVSSSNSTFATSSSLPQHNITPMASSETTTTIPITACSDTGNNWQLTEGLHKSYQFSKGQKSNQTQQAYSKVTSAELPPSSSIFSTSKIANNSSDYTKHLHRDNSDTRDTYIMSSHEIPASQSSEHMGLTAEKCHDQTIIKTEVNENILPPPDITINTRPDPSSNRNTKVTASSRDIYIGPDNKGSSLKADMTDAEKQGQSSSMLPLLSKKNSKTSVSMEQAQEIHTTGEVHTQSRHLARERIEGRVDTGSTN